MADPEKQKRNKRFSWRAHEQTLKDVILKLKDFSSSAMNAANIAKELREVYFIKEVDAEIVRTKLRLQTFEKWLALQRKKVQSRGTTETVNKKRKRVESQEEMNSDDSEQEDSDLSGDDINSEEDELEYLEKEKIGFSQYPKCWKIEDSNESWFFFRRNLKMRVEHRLGDLNLIIVYTIMPPTVFEMKSLISKCLNVSSLNSLDMNNVNIQNQIKLWKPITWKVSIPAPFPLVADSYRASVKDEYSWINIPKKSLIRSTDFGEDQIDVDNQKDEYL